MTRKEYKRNWRIKNKERYAIAAKKFFDAYPNKKLFSSAKRSSKERNIKFDLELADIVVPEYCPVFGVKLVRGNINGKYGGNDNSASLDRVDNSKGYIKENVCVISNRANKIKRDATLKELENIVAYIKDFFK